MIACLQFSKFYPVLDEIWYNSGKLVVTYTAIKQENNVIKMSESSEKHNVCDLSKAEEYLQINQRSKFGKCTWDVPSQVVRAKKATNRKT